MCPIRSVVERLAVNQEVAGSTPASGGALSGYISLAKTIIIVVNSSFVAFESTILTPIDIDHKKIMIFLV